VNKGTDQRKRPMRMDCLGTHSTRSSMLCGDSSRRYKQYPAPGVSVKICIFTARQRHCFDITDLKTKRVGVGVLQTLLITSGISAKR